LPPVWRVLKGVLELMGKKTSDLVRTTTLEMTSPPRIYPTLQTKAQLAVMRVPKIPLSFYRFLYGEIGKSHYWYLRNHLSDEELKPILHSTDIRINVLYHDGAPAGFAEFDLSSLPEAMELIYFGLCPEFIGRGLGKWFLGQTVRAAWEEMPEKIVVSTDTLDHSNALPLYQKLGFTPVAYKVEKMQDWLQSHN